MAKKQKKKTLEQICTHYSVSRKTCSHLQQDGTCSQRKSRPKLCRETILVKVCRDQTDEENEEYDLFS